jgi:hypothetical protein
MMTALRATPACRWKIVDSSLKDWPERVPLDKDSHSMDGSTGSHGTKEGSRVKVRVAPIPPM